MLFRSLPLKELKKKDIVIKRSNVKKYISAVAAAIILVFVLAPFGKRIYDNETQLSVAGFTTTENVSKPVAKAIEPSNVISEEHDCDIAPVAETVTQGIGTVVEEKSQPETVSVVAEQVAAVTPSEVLETVNTEKYSIIVASTPNPKNAQLAITELSRKMKADYEVVEGDRRFRIAIETYDNANDANMALERIQKTFSDAWIYVH